MSFVRSFMKNKYAWVGAMAAAVVVLDQITKYLVVKRFHLHESVTVIQGFFNLTYVRNKGAAFGILAGSHGMWRSAFFISVAFVALAAIVMLIKKSEDRLSIIAFSLIAGGAVGNLIDRLRLGAVVDFIEWYYRSYHWPTFNIADSAISAGVGLLAVEMLFPGKQAAAEDAEGK